MWIWKRRWVTHTSCAFQGHNNLSQDNKRGIHHQCSPRQELTSTVRATDDSCTEKIMYSYLQSALLRCRQVVQS